MTTYYVTHRHEIAILKNTLALSSICAGNIFTQGCCYGHLLDRDITREINSYAIL